MSATDWLSAVSAAFSAVAGVAAAVAAVRSAKAAEEAKQLAADAELRSARREIAACIADARTEHRRTHAMLQRLTILHRRNAVSSGTLGGSRSELLKNQAERRATELDMHYAASAPFRDGTGALLSATAEDAGRVLTNQLHALAEMRAIGAEVAAELQSAEAEQLQWFQTAIQPTTGK